MQIYETSYLILPSVPEDGLSKVVDVIKNIISKHGGVEIDEEAPFKQHLAYVMSKTVGSSRYEASDAYLGWIKFELDPQKTLFLKEEIEKIPELLRFLLVKAPRKTYFTFAKAQEKALLKKKEKEETLSSEVVKQEVQ